MFKIGVMGCGVVASYGHVPALIETPGLQLTALFDPDRSRLVELGSRYPGAGQYTDPTSFFELDMDAVVVASPAPFHIDNVRMAAAAGKHVLCEKPLATSEEEALGMIELMHSKGLMLFTGFCYRFSPVAIQIRDLVRRGAIGNVRSLRLMYLWNLDGKFHFTPDGIRVSNARRDERMLEGGPMVDCGVHQIDLARWWLGSEVVRHTGFGAWVEDYIAPDHVYVHLDHANGAHTMVEMSFSFTATARDPLSHFSYELIGTDGLIRYERDGWLLEMRNGYGTKTLVGSSEKNFHGMYAELEKSLRTGKAGDLPTGEDGVLATRIATEATQHAIDNRLQLHLK